MALDIHTTERKKLIHAAEHGDITSLKHLLSTFPNTIETLETLSWALCLAAKNGQKDSVKLLLDHGADIRSSLEDDSTALHLAIKHGHHEVAEFLLKRGAEVNALCNDGTHPQCYAIHGITPLHLAVQQRDVAGVTLLLNYGANPEAAHSNGSTPLSIARHHKDKKIEDLLTQAKLNVYIDEQRNPPKSIFNRFSFFGKPIQLVTSHAENVKAAEALQRAWGKKKVIEILPEKHHALEHGELGKIYRSAKAHLK